MTQVLVSRARDGLFETFAHELARPWLKMLRNFHFGEDSFFSPGSLTLRSGRLLSLLQPEAAEAGLKKTFKSFGRHISEILFYFIFKSNKILCH